MNGSELTLFIEQAPVAAAMFDRDMRYLAVSERWLSERNLDKSILGRTAYDVYPDTDHKFREFHQRALAGEIIKQSEDRLEVPHGAVDWLQWEMRPWRKANGEIGGIVIFTENITEKKNAQLGLIAATERLNLAQSAAQIAIWDWDIVANTAWVNEIYCSILGFPAHTSLAFEDFLDCVHPDDRKAYEGMAQHALSGNAKIDMDCRIVRKDNGEIRWVKSKGEVLFHQDGRPIRAMGAMWDITTLKETEARLLHRSDERYRRIIETAQEGIWLIDADGRTSFVNPKMTEILGYSTQEMRGRNLIDFMDEEWKLVAQNKLLDRTNGIVETHDFKFKRKDGSDIWALLSCTPIFEGTSYDGSLAMVVDFTERRRLQEKLQISVEELKKIELRRDLFLAKLAHELRTPLSSISLATGMIKMELEAPLKTEHLFKRLENQIHHLSRMIDDLSQVSYVKTGKLILEKEPLDLGELLSQTGDIYIEKFNERGVQLNISLFETGLKIIGDKVRLTQVFGNLLDNAAKYTGMSGTVHMTVFRQGSEAIVSVQDNGHGIPPEKISWIFELFNRIDDDDRSPHAGFGIGLALARELVELHNGSIEARSEGVGKGSEFIVRLPLVPPSNQN